MKRRTYLSFISLTGCVSLTGCFSSASPVASLALVEIENRTGEVVNIKVNAQKNGTIVHEDRYTIDGVKSGEETDHGYPSIDGVQIAEDWMADNAEFKFQFIIPEFELEDSFSTSDPIGDYRDAYQSELEGECYFIRVTIGDGSGNAALDAVPKRIATQAVVYDHEIFDRAHAGDCT